MNAYISGGSRGGGFVGFERAPLAHPITVRNRRLLCLVGNIVLLSFTVRHCSIINKDHQLLGDKVLQTSFRWFCS